MVQIREMNTWTIWCGRGKTGLDSRSSCLSPHFAAFHQGCAGSLEARGLQDIFWPVCEAPIEQVLKQDCVGQVRAGKNETFILALERICMS